MARLIQQEIKRPMADELLFGKLAKGGCIKVSVAADDKGEEVLAFDTEGRS